MHAVNVNQKTTILKMPGSRSVLRLGFVPLADCAPVLMAQELGLFRKHGLKVALHRELGWATIRDKVIHGELDAAHALAAMPVAASLGLGSIKCDCVTGLVLNLNGNAITLSNDLYLAGVRDGSGFKEQIIQGRHRKTFTFGIVSQFSSHNFLLRKWLSKAGVNPDRDVRIVVVPPPQMVANLKAGHLDGFCVGEPWNSVAVQSRVGWCVATSAELQPGHPEKVLMARKDFAENNNDEHIALIAALLEACAYCQKPENHDRVLDVLARPDAVNVPTAALRRGFDGNFDFGFDQVRTVSDFNVFHRDDSNEPSGEKAAWVFQLIRSVGLPDDPSLLNFALGRSIFRADLFEKASALSCSTKLSNEKETTPESRILIA
jgi:ABC-type nitrate/sulfonate/bicarbonate transport system substrate-binding protein